MTKPLDTIDESSLEGERLEQHYILLSVAAALGARDNVKRHDIGKLCESMASYGFGDPPKYDANLININNEPGALVYGNGRIAALSAMFARGDDRPRGILQDADGRWFVPVTFGVDSIDEAQALAFNLDHNLLTLSGSELQNFEQARIFDDDKLMELLSERPEIKTVGFDALDIQELFEPNSTRESGSALCPECGHEFSL